MSTEEEFKSFKLQMDYYDEDVKHSLREMTIKVNKPKSEFKHGFSWKRQRYSMTFSMVIPEHIHAFIIGKTVPVSGMGHRNDSVAYDTKFSKTINAETIASICDQYDTILEGYKWLKDREKAALKKVIFYCFKNSTEEYRSTWNGITFGKTNDMSFQYAIGYVSTANNTEYRYNINKELIHNNHDRVFYMNKYVTWSEEREEFYNNLQTSFEMMIKKINDFEEGLTEETISEIIQKQQKLLS